MSSVGSVTHWIHRLKAGDQAAAQKLWESYFRRLVGIARKKLQTLPRRAVDEEDVALSAFDSFCRGVAVWKMEGYSVGEIAAKLGCVPRTVARKLEAIRTIWEKRVVP